MKRYYAVHFWLFPGLAACSSDGDGGNPDIADVPTGLTKAISVPTAAETLVPATATPDAVALDADELLPFREGFAIVKKGESQALINAKSDTVIPFNKYIFGAFQGDYRDKNCRLVSASQITDDWLPQRLSYYSPD